jgi:hypothetical protein
MGSLYLPKNVAEYPIGSTGLGYVSNRSSRLKLPGLVQLGTFLPSGPSLLSNMVSADNLDTRFSIRKEILSTLYWAAPIALRIFFKSVADLGFEPTGYLTY